MLRSNRIGGRSGHENYYRRPRADVAEPRRGEERKSNGRNQPSNRCTAIERSLDRYASAGGRSTSAPSAATTASAPPTRNVVAQFVVVTNQPASPPPKTPPHILPE